MELQGWKAVVLFSIGNLVLISSVLVHLYRSKREKDLIDIMWKCTLNNVCTVSTQISQCVCANLSESSFVSFKVSQGFAPESQKKNAQIRLRNRTCLKVASARYQSYFSFNWNIFVSLNYSQIARNLYIIEFASLNHLKTRHLIWIILIIRMEYVLNDFNAFSHIRMMNGWLAF